MGVLFYFLAALLAAQPGQVAGRDLYYKALAEGRAGQNERAAALLGQVVEQYPDDPFADDALAERARIFEQQLGKPARALKLYRRLIERYPNSRLVRRARSRIDYLAGHLDAGGAVLAAYMRIQRESEHAKASESIERMRRLLSAHPKFSLRPDGLYWVATMLSRAGRQDEARKCLLDIAREFPDSQMAGRALVELANLEIGRGNLNRAGRAFDRLGRLPGGKWESSMREGLLRLSRLRRIRRVEIGVALYWAVAAVWLWLAFGLALRSGKLELKKLLRPPVELVVFLLVMAGLIAWAVGGARQTSHALMWMTGLFGLLLMPNRWPMRVESSSTGRLVLRLLGLASAGLAAVVISIWLAGLAEQVLHTFQFGVNG